MHAKAEVKRGKECNAVAEDCTEAETENVRWNGWGSKDRGMGKLQEIWKRQ